MELIRVRVQYALRQQCCKTHKRPLPFFTFNVITYVTLYLKLHCPASFRETCQWLKFPLNGLRARSRASPVVGLLPLASGPAWTIKARDARRITAAEMKYMRGTARYTWTDCKTNTQITKELKITPILDKLLECKRNWIQHVNRMTRNRLPTVMKHYSATDRRNHGRPLKRLLDT